MTAGGQRMPVGLADGTARLPGPRCKFPLQTGAAAAGGPGLARLALLGHGGLRLRDRVLVAQVVVLDRLQVFVEFVDERDAVRDVQADDVVVARCCRGTSPARGSSCRARRSRRLRPDLMAGAIDSFQQRQHARDGVLQALGERHCSRGDLGVARIVALAARVVRRIERRRRRVVAAAPDQHLLVAELARRSRPCSGPAGRRSGARSGASRLHHRQPGAVHLVEHVPQGADRALEHRGVGDVELVARLPSAARPACCACATPWSVRSTSVQPVKRFSRFQVDSPWRIRTSLCMRLPVGSKEAVKRCEGPLEERRHRVRRLFYNGWIALFDFSLFRRIFREVFH